MNAIRLILTAALCTALAACGGHGAWSGNNDDDDGDSGDPSAVPSAPQHLAANAGDRAVSLGWDVPSTVGSGSITYKIDVSPTVSAARATISGTRALVRGLSNDVTYTLSVTATNSAGTGTAASIQAKPATVAASAYQRVTFNGNPQLVNGFADASLLRTSGGAVWMAYSDVDATGSGQILRSSVRLAQSTDGGATYVFSKEIAAPVATTVLVPGGEWHYRTPWLIEDSTDPDSSRRFKLFAQKYYFDPLSNTFNYRIGAIAMWTAPALDQQWSKETIVLGWSNGTPTELKPLVFVDTLNAALQSCLWIDEGSAAIGSNGIDFAFSCAIDNSPFPIQRQVVLLRSADNAKTFTYVSTPLVPAAAPDFDADSFSMPSLLPNAGTAPVLIASPIDSNGNALGCVVFPIADPTSGLLFTDSNAPLALQSLPPLGSDSGGCAWDRGITTNGILMNDRNGSTYTIQATGKAL